MLAWLPVRSKVQTGFIEHHRLSSIQPNWCHCHSLPLPSVKSRLVLPFWYQLTWVVPSGGFKGGGQGAMPPPRCQRWHLNNPSTAKSRQLLGDFVPQTPYRASTPGPCWWPPELAPSKFIFWIRPWYQKGKTNLDFTEARDSEWQWHQLDHMQVCTSLQTDNNAIIPPLSFLQAGCPSCCPTNSVKALKALRANITHY